MRIGPVTTVDRWGIAWLSPAAIGCVTAHIDDAVAKGARVLAGGRAPTVPGPVLRRAHGPQDVKDDMAVCREDTPVGSLHCFVVPTTSCPRAKTLIA